MVTAETLSGPPPADVDYRDEVPDIGRLLPHEQVFPKPYEVKMKPPSRYLTPEEALCALTGVKRFKDIGKAGPSKAALPAPGNENVHELKVYSEDGNLFGRDSLIVALDVFPLVPRLLRTTLRELAKLQGVTVDTYREEEPGKILHENRRPGDPIAIKITESSKWGWPYYGSVDASLLWLIGMQTYCTRSREGLRYLATTFKGRDKQTHTMAEAYDNTFGWVLGKTGNGKIERLLEYKQSFPGSLTNQNWTDSVDAAHHENGVLANPRVGVATVDIQGLAYDALIGTADLYDQWEADLKLHYPQLRLEHPDDLRQRAADLKKMTMDMLWMGDHFALGYDRDDAGNPRVMDIWRSNMGHLLNSRMLDDEPLIRDATVEAIFSPKMRSDYGIRTLAEDEARFKPGSYHNGSEWPHDNEIIAKGLRRHGCYGLSAWLRVGNLETFEKFQKYPEFRRGDNGAVRLNGRVVTIWDGQYGRYYTAEQPPQEYQAWAVSAALAARYDFEQDLALSREGQSFARSDEARFLDQQILATLPQRAAA